MGCYSCFGCFDYWDDYCYFFVLIRIYAKMSIMKMNGIIMTIIGIRYTNRTRVLKKGIVKI